MFAFNENGLHACTDSVLRSTACADGATELPRLFAKVLHHTLHGKSQKLFANFFLNLRKRVKLAKLCSVGNAH